MDDEGRLYLAHLVSAIIAPAVWAQQRDGRIWHTGDYGPVLVKVK